MDATLAHRIADLEARLGALAAELGALRAQSGEAKEARPTAFEHNRRFELAFSDVARFGVRCPCCARDGHTSEMTGMPGGRQSTIDCGDYLLLDAFCAACGTTLKLWRSKD